MRNVFVPVLLGLSLLVPQAQAGELRLAPSASVPGQYIVVFEKGARGLENVEALVAPFGGEVVERWTTALDGMLVRGLSLKQAEALAQNPLVAYVEQDAIGEITATQNTPPWGLDRIDQADLPLSATYTYDFDGTDVHAYILDTGLRDTHTEFGTRATRDFDAVGDGQNGNDCNGHGTHVAGTIGSATYGVAKNVRLHGVRVCTCGGSCTSSAVISGVQWVMNNRTWPAVANMSLRFDGGNSSVDSAVSNAIASGVFFAVAAGNDADDACEDSPARVGTALTVGATDSADNQAWFSNFGTCLDLYAPGVDVLSTSNGSDSATATLSGTSMASPHAAGAAALLLDQTPALEPAQIANDLIARAVTGRVVGAGTGSPNRLLQTLSSAITTPVRLNIYRGLCYGLNDAEWSAVTGATYYQLYISTSSTFTTQSLLYSGPNLDHTFNVSGTRYLRVRACNASGCGGYRNGDRSATYTNGCL
ncbi:MAG TPA: S8 family serine peptidase [Thermoanaerobaculia bacterium]|nr:S8 family serine peptidase [Thermoanaerobaculia bacterium]